MTDKERHYRLLKRRGFPEKHARRLAHGLFQLAGINTAATFAAGMDRVGVLADKDIRNHHLKKAAAAGVSTTGKVYMGGLAKENGDPGAWVSEMDAKADIRTRCVKEGFGCEGSVKVAKPISEEADIWAEEDAEEGATVWPV